MKVYLFILLCISTAQAENLCKKAPRAPSPGCCPDGYTHLCCLGIPPCNPTNATSFNSSIPATPGRRNSSEQLQGHSVVKYPCSPPWNSPACAKGFYNLNGTTAACPPGFYCPELSTCMLPCPLGAYCMQYTFRYENSPPRQGVVQPLCKSMGMCCISWQGKLEAPTQVTSKNGSKAFICPGMAKPDPCPKGYYCPDTVTRLICKSGHFCPDACVEPRRCPILTICSEGTSAPLNNVAGPLLAAFIFIAVVVAYQVFIHFSAIKFYFNLYCCELVGKDRSLSLAFNVTDGMKGFTLNMKELNAKSVDGAEIEPKEYTIDIAFSSLSLTLKSGNKKVVLSGVTGAVMSGEVTAVMGPSGAGKTTFLNALSGKAYYGDIGGKLMVNGEEVDSLSKYRKVTGFVPQEDIMHRKLTVEEVLTFQGRLRLPGCTPAETIKHRVSEILKLLEIAHVADVPIGDEETRGISGGQRKRVNIGMELIADPTLLFLDEPTSGLDSTSSLSVLRALRAVAEKGRLTVVCVIHQPRYEIFAMFHKLLFLGPGGRTVYQGDVEGAKEYFDGMGYPCPANINPADHYMDVIGGVLKKSDKKFDPVVLFDAWARHAKEQKSMQVNETDHGDGIKCDSLQVLVKPGNFEDRSMPNIFLQFIIFLKREGILQFRYIRSLLLDLFLVLIAGGILGGLYAEVSLEKTITMNTMSSLAIGLTSILASLRCFGNHRTTYWRESAAGVNRFAYFLAVNVCQIPIIVFAPLLYISLQYSLTWPRALFKHHYLAVLMAQFATSGIGYAISCIFNPRSSQMAAVVVVLISSMLAGSMPTLCKLNELKVLGPMAYSLSYCRWFVEALFEKEAERYSAVLQTSIDFLAYGNNYNLESFGLCMAVLFIFGIVFRIISYLFLVFTNRGQQQ